MQRGKLTLRYLHSPFQLYMEYGLAFLAMLLSLAMAISMIRLNHAVHCFANLVKLMGSYIQKVSSND